MLFKNEQSKKDFTVKLCLEETPVRVYYKDGRLAYGKFVCLDDFTELYNKGFVRFVAGGRIEAFDIKRETMYSKIIKVEEIKDFVVFETVDNE